MEDARVFEDGDMDFPRLEIDDWPEARSSRGWVATYLAVMKTPGDARG